MPATIKCPIRGRPVAWIETDKFRPFCGERCKLADLGAWAAESYAIPAEDAPPPETPAERDETTFTYR